MMRMRATILAAMLLSLAGCASIERFQRNMDAYLGMDINQLRSQFGYNYIERKLDDGMRAYTWTRVERGTIPGYRSPDIIRTYQSSKGTHVVLSPGYYFPPEYYERICEFSFIVDAEGRAISWRAQGNGCAVLDIPQRVIKSRNQ